MGMISPSLRDAFHLYGQAFRQVARTLTAHDHQNRFRPREILQHCVHIGVESLPIVLVATAFAGIVVSYEMAWHMQKAVSSLSLVPGFTGQFILRELGVVIPALLVVSKVGASITAEISTMKITDQLDALKLLRVNALAYLVFPRWIACMISLFCLTLIAVFVTILCAMWTACARYGFNELEYLNVLRQFVSLSDIVCAGIKSLVFGSVIPVIACAYGMNAREGAQGVGQATTDAVVGATMAVIVLDFLITFLFTS